MAIITISRLTGSGGREIASAAADALGFQLIDRNVMEALVGEQFPVRLEEMARVKQDRRVYQEMVRSAVAEVARQRNMVILGSGGQFLFSRIAASLHIQIVAPLAYRVARVMRVANTDRSGAENIIRERDEAKRLLVHDLYGADWRDPDRYDLVINLDHFSNDVAVELIITAARAKGIEAQSVELPPELREEILTAKLDVAQLANIEPAEDKLPAFAHSSEREFARVMDFYRIRWQYEPKTFPIEWDEQKNVVAAFTPDFYLPDLDLYIELTTMKQSLVTKKNRKVRLLRELYPEVNIKILYERDYRNLIWKYGLTEPEEQNGGNGNRSDRKAE
jgi:cytidylate kinase